MSKEINFEESFTTNFSSCVGTCECGRVFYNSQDTGCFEREELEALENNKNATEINHSVGYVRFEGKQYANCCDCWLDRAKMIMRFIDSHGAQIAQYLNKERQRKISEAELVEIVED